MNTRDPDDHSSCKRSSLSQVRSLTPRLISHRFVPTGRNERKDASPPRRRALRQRVGEATAQQGSRRGRRHV